MNLTATLFIVLLVVAGVALLYVLIQQRLNDISDRLSKLQTPAPQNKARPADDVRRELAAARDELMLLEARLVSQAVEELNAEDIQSFERARKKVKACIDKLKQSGDWVGMPFDLEWPELQARLPRLDALYRRAVQAEVERINNGDAPR